MKILAKARKKIAVKKQHLASLEVAHKGEKLKQKPPKIKHEAEKEELVNLIVMKTIRKDVLLENLL